MPAIVDEIDEDDDGRPNSLLAIMLARSASVTRAADKLAMFVGPPSTSARIKVTLFSNK